MDVFRNRHATVPEIKAAGVALFQGIYKGSGFSLATNRYHRLQNQLKAGTIRPASLPPTEDAAEQHALRAWLQAMDWILLTPMSHNPLEFGFYRTPEGRIEPVAMTKAIGPEHLLKLICCGCKGDCNNKICSCRKHGVPCIAACSHCHGTSCSNVSTVV